MSTPTLSDLMAQLAKVNAAAQQFFQLVMVLNQQVGAMAAATPVTPTPPQPTPAPVPPPVPSPTPEAKPVAAPALSFDQPANSQFIPLT